MASIKMGSYEDCVWCDALSMNIVLKSWSVNYKKRIKWVGIFYVFYYYYGWLKVIFIMRFNNTKNIPLEIKLKSSQLSFRDYIVNQTKVGAVHEYCRAQRSSLVARYIQDLC